MVTTVASIEPYAFAYYYYRLTVDLQDQLQSWNRWDEYGLRDFSELVRSTVLLGIFLDSHASPNNYSNEFVTWAIKWLSPPSTFVTSGDYLFAGVA